jgi:hypothetical protein
MSPTLPVYQTGVVLNWRPDVAGTGGATTIKIGALAAVSLKLADGSTDPGAADIVAGQIYPIWFDGTAFRMITASSTRSGTSLLCASASASATAYTCSMSPTLPVYQTGVVLNWRPDVAGTGGATTIKIGALAAVSLKLADGSTDPGAADIVAGQIYPIWFDGTAFRMITSNPVVAQSAVARPACSVSLRGRLWHVFGATNVKDSVSVCAKDATNTYDWRVLY